MNKRHLLTVKEDTIRSMCDSFEVDFQVDMYEKYQKPSMKYQLFGELKLILKDMKGCTYIDKLWVENKSQGIGSRYLTQYFKKALEHDTMLVWRTHTYNRKEWYLRFDGVKLVATYDGYYYFVYNKPNTHSWTYEDIPMFTQPSMFT